MPPPVRSSAAPLDQAVLPADAGAIARAAALLSAGDLVVIPTETVYGLAARADRAEAVGRIYAAKGRPACNPLIVHLPDAATARRWAGAWPTAAERLAERFWPGPLTLVVPGDERLPPIVRAGGPTVALRVPSHPVAQAVLRACGLPLAAPSANRSGHISPTRAEHVQRSLRAAVGLILDAGPTTVGVESTVVSVAGDTPVLLRPGTITQAALEAVVGPVQVRAIAAADDAVAALPSPGLLSRHYAPAAFVCLFDADEWPAVREELQRRVGAGERVGVLLRSVRAGPPQVTEHLPERAVVRALPDAPAPYAAGLYDALHALEAAGCSWLAIEAAPEDPAWHAVADRLARAATPA